MDRGVWHATVNRVTKSDRTKHIYTYDKRQGKKGLMFLGKISIHFIYVLLLFFASKISLGKD